MKIGILSDTHNNLDNLEKALERLRQEGVTTLFHCGDLTDAKVARKLGGFHVICVLGNGDVASGEIRDALRELDSDNYVGMVYTGQINGTRIAATHGHVPGTLDELLHSEAYDYVFKGHSHRHQEKLVGFTRLINPGALGGLHVEKRQFCLLDLESGKAEFIQIED